MSVGRFSSDLPSLDMPRAEGIADEFGTSQMSLVLAASFDFAAT